MNFQLPISNSQKETTKDTKSLATKNTKFFLLVFFVTFVANNFVTFVAAQQLLDRVVARVGTSPIMQTDVDAAVAFGVIDPKAGDPVKQMIERRLVIAEVNRFPPPEPTEMAINELVAKMKATAGAQTAAVIKRTGADEKRLAEFARETLRIERYIAQRFGNGPRADQQRASWLEGLHTRGDVTEVVTSRP